MKVTLLLLFIITIQQTASAVRAITPLKQEQCLNDQGKSKTGSHCVCFTGKTLCESGKGTCIGKYCEEWTCTTDKDCSQISAKCVEKFCKL